MNLTKKLENFLENKVLMGLFLAFFVLGFKIPFINLPLWWDEGNYFEGALRIYKNNLNPFIEWWSYKPPLVYEISAFSFRLFGVNRGTPRLIVIFFALLALYFTFLLGKRLYSSKVGFFASLLLFFSPLFFAQSGLFHADLPLAALVLIVLYCFLSKKRASYFIAASLMALTKEAAILVIMAILIYEALFNFRKILSRPFLLKSLFITSPLLFFLSWMLFNKRYLGWYLWPYNVGYFSSFPKIEELWPILDFAFWRDFRFLITFPLVIGVVFSFFQKKLRGWLIKRELVLLFLLVVISLFFFWWGPFLPRYLLIFQPLFFIAGTAAILGCFPQKIIYFPILITVGLFFISSWFTPKFEWGGEINLNYIHGIRVYEKTAQFLENNFPSFKIVTIWPLVATLEMPELGYVSNSFDVSYYSFPFQIEEKTIAALSEFNLGWQKESNDLLLFLRESKVNEKPVAILGDGETKVSLYLLNPYLK